ncbi:DUF1254 domain-containing protein [Methylocystis sp. MJC1]|uniref:DUF1254 domain-containing protein n=1 Tax=Methylocystis sp. MJC1 TaxID=2654282 RepID=UPI0013EC5162|nr:DUF1254 domain-containing protein [Methylocystis sp. MJC1]KAF2991355.1 hypothetical protein MJC1_01704 [Methylocystis sp. MJC1]MBU6526107.1 DUF1254 domain-containing protein [Methylocystis sp. MJC1]UZX12564.1 DUF1254 domain-containing protein [Methylocystis sp. MJC1]
MRLALPDRFFDYLPWAAATLLVAGIVHIVSVLLMPTLAPRDAYARTLAAVGDAPTGLVALPPMAPDAEPLPFEDPAFAEGVCVYDLSKGMLRVTAPADGEDYLALSFHARGSRIYHAITDRAAIKGKIDIVIGDERQMDALQSASDEAPQQEVRLTAPSKRGFVLVRSLAKRPSDMARARERLASVICERVDPPKD